MLVPAEFWNITPSVFQGHNELSSIDPRPHQSSFFVINFLNQEKPSNLKRDVPDDSIDDKHRDSILLLMAAIYHRAHTNNLFTY